MAHSRAEGWTDVDPLHEELLRYEFARGILGDTVVEGPSGPEVEWPAQWGRAELCQHRVTIARHRAEMDAIHAAERSGL